MPDERLSPKDYARSRKVSRAVLYDHIKKGRLERDANGHISVEAADRLWEWSLIPPQPTPAQQALLAGNGLNTVSDLQNVKRTELLRLVQLYKVENSRRMATWRSLLIERVQKSLLPADGVKRACFEQLRILRDHLTAFVERVSPVTASMQDQEEIRKYLDKEMRATLNAIADTFRDIAINAAKLNHDVANQEKTTNGFGERGAEEIRK